MARRSSPEVNAGSMADIAFLLLIFFLVTTTIETDSGISRKLPPMEESEEDVVIKQKNIFTVLLNGKDQLLVEDELMDLEELRESAIEFLDNGGGTGEDACNYCKGKKDPKSSDNPDKAIISLKNERETSYATYISVQNELVAAYTHLRNVRAQELYGESYSEMMKNYKDVNWPGNRDKLKENINRPLAAILTVNTIANTIGAAGVGAQTLVIFGSEWVAVASGILTLCILIFSEIIPKTIGAIYSKSLVSFSAYSIRILMF